MERPENIKFVLNDIKSNILDMYIKNLEKENERLNNAINNSVSLAKYNKLNNEKEQLELTLSVIKDNRLIIKKAIEIYENRNSIRFKKQRFMEDKDTGDLMYDILKGE